MLPLALALLGHPVLPHGEHSRGSMVPRRFRSHHWKNESDSSECKDLDADCPEAASQGACSKEAEFMRANCQLSCQLCGTLNTNMIKARTPKEPHAFTAPQCKAVTVQAGVPGRMRGPRMYCSERYSEDLECQGRTFDFARLERGRDTWDIIERDGSSRLDGSTTRFNQRAHPWESNPVDRPWSFGEKEPKVVLKGPLTSQATHNLAFLCNDDGSVSYYGGRVKAASRYPTIGSQEFYQNHFPGLERVVGRIEKDGSITWTEPTQILDEKKGRDLQCVDLRKGVDVCELDGKLSATNFKGYTYIFGRANLGEDRDSTVARADTGGRHVQMTRHKIGDHESLEPFKTLEFEGYEVGTENNIYFMAVKALRNEMLVGLFPAIIEGKGGIYLSSSKNGVQWTQPQLLMESEHEGPRTRDFPVDGFVIEDYRLVFSVDHQIYLEHDDACDAPPYTCTYEVTGTALQKLLGKQQPPPQLELPPAQQDGPGVHQPEAGLPKAAHRRDDDLMVDEDAQQTRSPSQQEAQEAKQHHSAQAKKQEDAAADKAAVQQASKQEALKTTDWSISPLSEVSDEPCKMGVPHKLDAVGQAATGGGAFACCPAACGTCGGTGCEDRPGGMRECCMYSLVAANKKCEDATSVACIVPGLDSGAATPSKEERHEALETVTEKIEAAKDIHSAQYMCKQYGEQCDQAEKLAAAAAAAKKALAEEESKAKEHAQQERNAKVDAVQLGGYCANGLTNPLTDEYRDATNGGAFACCPAQCNKCGGVGCEGQPGGAGQCCAYGLVERNVKCEDTSSVGCIVHQDQMDAGGPAPATDVPSTAPFGASSPLDKAADADAAQLGGYCANGLTNPLTDEYRDATNGGAFACCPAQCGQCGGGGCEDQPGGAGQCCGYGLVERNVKCEDKSSVGCIVHQDQLDAEDTGASSAPTPTTPSQIRAGGCFGTACTSSGDDRLTTVDDAIQGASDALTKTTQAHEGLANEIKDAIAQAHHDEETDARAWAAVAADNANDDKEAKSARDEPMTGGLPASKGGYCANGFTTRLDTKASELTGGGQFACCPASCGGCGRGGCEDRPGGFENCCAYGLVTENVRCKDESSVSCIVHDAQHVGELKAPADNMRGDGAVAAAAARGCFGSACSEQQSQPKPVNTGCFGSACSEQELQDARAQAAAAAREALGLPKMARFEQQQQPELQEARSRAAAAAEKALAEEQSKAKELEDMQKARDRAAEAARRDLEAEEAKARWTERQEAQARSQLLKPLPEVAPLSDTWQRELVPLRSEEAQLAKAKAQSLGRQEADKARAEAEAMERVEVDRETIAGLAAQRAEAEKAEAAAKARVEASRERLDALEQARRDAEEKAQAVDRARREAQAAEGQARETARRVAEREAQAKERVQTDRELARGLEEARKEAERAKAEAQAQASEVAEKAAARAQLQAVQEARRQEEEKAMRSVRVRDLALIAQ